MTGDPALSPGGTGRLRRLGAGVAGAAALITLLTLAARVVGFARWFALNAWVGPNDVGTAYSTANTVPNVLFEVAAGGALAGAVVPLLAGPIARHLRADVDRTASAMLTWAVAVLVPVAALTFALAPLAVRALLGSVETVPGQVELATTLLRVFSVQIPLYGVGVVLSGVLQAHRRFVWPALAPLLSSLVVMGSYAVVGALVGPDPTPQTLSTAAVAWLGWGTTAGVVVLSLPLAIPVARLGVRLRATFTFPEGVARRARSLALAGAGGLVAQQISVMVGVWVANRYGVAGTLNVHQYAQAVVLLPYAVLAIPVATAMFPRLADLAATGRRDALARESAGSTRVIVVVAAVGAAALAAAAGRVEQVFGAYARGDAGVQGMAGAVVAASLSVVGLALVFHLSRVLYAVERNRVALVATSLGWGTVTLAALVGAAVVVGTGTDATATLQVLGAAASVGSLVGALALLVGVRRTLGADATRGVARTALVSAAAAVVAAVAGRWVADLDLGGGVTAAVVAGLLAGAVAALVTAVLTALGDRQAVTRLLAARRGGRPQEEA